MKIRETEFFDYFLRLDVTYGVNIVIQQGFINESNDDLTKGKTLSAIKNSRANYSSWIALFGGIDLLPSSVMKAKRERPNEIRDACAAERSYGKTAPGYEKAKSKVLPKALRSALQLSGRGCGAGALSTFPQAIGRSIVLFYSEPGDTIFDPFAGHNSRMDLSVKAGRNYIGCDLSTAFMEFNFQRADELRTLYPKAQIELHHCDSRKVPVKSEAGDFTLTSPPYYDIEEYGDEPEQLGKSKTYKEFLEGLGKVIGENFRVLKPGAYAVWFINDFRKKGKMYFYHMDVLRLGKRVGFVPHDIVVVDFGHGIRDCFVNQTMEQRILPKRHEYGVIFRKPLDEKS